MHITFIQTGGTIDKDYPRTSGGYAFEFGEPATKRILQKLQPSFDFEVVTLCQKDSQEITNGDRQKIADYIEKSDGEKFIITHGTDTMIETGRYLADRISDKLIILTGAMRPERFNNSDAGINIGTAIGAANTLQKGVYIAMHGIVKLVIEMQRNMETGQFY